jgi:CBS domain-containing protein
MEESMATLLARDVMTTDVATVGEDWSLEQLARFLVDRSISGAPVVTPYGKLVGVVSVTDLARAQTGAEAPAEIHDFFAKSFDSGFSLSPDELQDLHIAKESGRRVRDIMTPAVFEVSEDASIPEIAEMMVRGRIHRVFVLRDRAVAGVVSALDLIKLLR